MPSLPSGDAVGSLDVSLFYYQERYSVHSCRDVYVETRFLGHRLSSENIIERLLIVFRLNISLVDATEGKTDEEDIMSVQLGNTSVHSPVE